MNDNEHNHTTIPDSDSQDPGEEIEVEASLNDMAISVLKGLLYRRPPEFWGDWLEDALKAILDIPGSLNAQPDYTDLLQRIADGIDRLVEEIKEQNRLRTEEEPPEATTKGSRPLKPLPVGGRKPRRKASPSLERLRKSRREGG